eukprot:sb/3469695/
MVGYGLFVFLYRLVPLISGITRPTFPRDDVYCWDDSNTEGGFYLVVQIMGCLLLLPPFFLVTASCVVSVRLVYRRVEGGVSGLKRQASITIVLFTALYIVCNAPLIVNMIIWIWADLLEQDEGYFQRTVYRLHYSWNTSDVLCVILNSTGNFLIYLTRKRDFRAWLLHRSTGIRLMGYQPVNNNNTFPMSPRCRTLSTPLRERANAVSNAKKNETLLFPKFDV